MPSCDVLNCNKKSVASTIYLDPKTKEQSIQNLCKKCIKKLVEKTNPLVYDGETGNISKEYN